MNIFLRGLVLIALSFGGAFTPLMADEAAIAGAVASESRSAADRERDARSKPEETLALLDLQPGDDVVDLLGGGGYYAELMASIVGENGSVILQNNTPYMKFVEKQLQERYIDNQVPGITVLKSEVDDLQLGEGSLDAALMVMSFHDLYYVNPERGWGETDIPLFLGQLHAALRDGGKLMIIDHAAEAGSGKSSAGTVHRIDAGFVRTEIESNGFRFVGSSDALRNPADDYSKMVFDKGVRGTTDRFVLLFAKD